MYVIRDKKTKVVLDMVQSPPGEDRKPKDVYPDFDAKTMEFGKSEEPAIPAWFTIENGIVKAVEPPADRAEADAGEAAKSPTPSIDELKASAIEYYSKLSMDLRQALIPDYKLQNAALGVYDDAETAAIRNTVKAFRDEFYRLKGAIESVKSVKGFKEVAPHFPTQLVAVEPERIVKERPERPRKPNG